MIEYSLEDSGIFKVIFRGEVNVNDIRDYLLEFEKIDSLNKDILLLYDLREAKMKITLKDIFAISKAAKKATLTYDSVRTAFLVTQPNLTAYSILFTKDLASSNTKRKVFSTENIAFKWLLSK